MAGNDWFFSRSDAELYDTCPRARYHRTIGHTGRGVVRRGSSFDLELGRIVHKASEWVMLERASLAQAAAWACSSIVKVVNDGEYPPQIHDEFKDQFIHEAESLAGGLVWLWGLHVMPGLLADHKVLQVEEQAVYRKDGMALPTVADLVLEASDGSLIYPDWKTTKWVNPQWMDQWNRAAQLHTTVRALEQSLGREVEYCMVQALVKGKWQNGYQQSPLCWGWFNKDAADTEDDPAWSYKYKAGKKWTKTPSWLSGKSLQQWVTDMPKVVAMALVPRTQPIVVDPDLAETWWRQRVIKEKRIQEAKEELTALENLNSQHEPLWYSEETPRRVMDAVFPQHFGQCNPVIGHRCDYYELCHDPHGIGADPIGSGTFRRRPTHEERAAVEEDHP